MARRRKIRKAHPRFFRFLTIFGATVGIIGSSAFSVMMAIDAAKGDLITDELREYTASFSSEGSVISKNVYKRGEEIVPPENPEHAIDGESNYFFIGWDTNGNGIPDMVPKRAYYSFDAQAVYFRTGKFDLNFLDLLNMDLEDLLALLEKLNIDWETFMKMFNITPEMLMQLLQGQIAFTYETNPAISEYPAYFRSTSYGDFDYSKKSFKAPDFYDANLISDNSVNPLSFTAYKLKQLQDAGALPSTFGFVDYDITYNAKEEYYPTPECSVSDEINEYGNSDAHYIVEPIDNKLHTSAVYCPAFSYVINTLSAFELPTTLARDERKYYQYALDHYTSVPREYESVLDDMIIKNDWYEDEYFQVDAIASYVSNLGTYNIFNDDGSVDVNSYLNSKSANKDPVMGLIETKSGSDLDFNTTAVLLFRRLHIPARLVKGYLGAGSNGGVNQVYLMQQHYWCEIYVKGTGWMICECTNLSNILGTDPYGIADQNNTPMQNKHILERIVVNEPSNKEYYIGDSLNLADGSITAFFQDGATTILNFTSPGVTITGFDSSEVNPTQKITVSYTYEGKTEKDYFFVSINSKDNRIVSITFNFTAFEDEYYQGQDIDTSGIVATAFYKEGDPVILDSDEIIVSNYDKNELGEQTIRVTVNNGTSHLTMDKKSATVNVTVYKKKATSLAIETPASKLEFFENDKFVHDDLEVRVYYYDGTSELTEEYIVIEPTNAEMATAGTYSVQIRFDNDKPGDAPVYTSYQITVIANGMINLSITGYKNSYRVGETFDQSDFFKNATVQVTYKETGTETVTNGLSASIPDLSTTGTKYITVTYTNADYKTITRDVTINVTAGTVRFDFTYSIDDFFEVTYDGTSHKPANSTIKWTAVGDFPTFLEPEFQYVPVYDDDNGRSSDIFQYVPQLVAIWGSTGDVKGQYNWSLGETEGITYVVNQRPITVTMTPSVPSNQTIKPGVPFNVSVTVPNNVLVEGDTLGYSGNENISFATSGDHENYPIDVWINGYWGGDATNCYEISYVRNIVRVRD